MKVKFVFVRRSWYSFGLFNFVESFSIMWTALLKVVFSITVAIKFPISETFTVALGILAKLAFFWIMSVVYAEVWLLYVACFEIFCRLTVSFDFRISRACLRISWVAWPADIALRRVNSDSWRRRYLKVLLFVPQTIISFIKVSWKVSNSVL